jgi:hypothetical protein
MMPFVEARAYMHKQKLKGEKEWRLWSKSGQRPSNIPSSPHKLYKSVFVSYPDFLGYGPAGGGSSSSGSSAARKTTKKKTIAKKRKQGPSSSQLKTVKKDPLDVLAAAATAHDGSRGSQPNKKRAKSAKQTAAETAAAEAAAAKAESIDLLASAASVF